MVVSLTEFHRLVQQDGPVLGGDHQLVGGARPDAAYRHLLTSLGDLGLETLTGIRLKRSLEGEANQNALHILFYKPKKAEKRAEGMWKVFFCVALVIRNRKSDFIRHIG